jgi:hypothetical protein
VCVCVCVCVCVSVCVCVCVCVCVHFVEEEGETFLPVSEGIPTEAELAVLALMMVARLGVIINSSSEWSEISITSAILECLLLHSASASFLRRSVLLAANPGSPNPSGGSPVGTKKQEHYKVSNVSCKCTTLVCLCHRARTRICAVVFEFTHAMIRASMSTHTLQVVEG